MSSLWEKFILNDFMRSDVKIGSTEEDLKNLLINFSKDMDVILNSEDTLNILTNNIKKWPYDSKEYSIKDIISDGIKYDVDQTVKCEKKGDKSYLKKVQVQTL